MSPVPLMPRTLTPFYDHWRPTPVDRRRIRCGRKALELLESEEGGRPPYPALPAGEAVGTSTWGRLWRERLETAWRHPRRLAAGLALFEDRLVLDLIVTRGRVAAMVGNRGLERVTVDVRPPSAAARRTLLAASAGLVPSVTDLLDGRLPSPALDLLAARAIPAARELDARCTCGRGSGRCIHAVAALYGLAARFDEDPAALFVLRGLSPAQLYDAGATITLARAIGPGKARRILSALRLAGATFGP